MNPNDFSPKHLYTVRYTLKPAEIGAFLGALHEVQQDMIEDAVMIKEAQGFPEANELLANFRLQ